MSLFNLLLGAGLFLCCAAVAVIFFPVFLAIKLYASFTTGVCRSKNRLDGKTVVLTGGNSGIGKETAIDLAKRGARIIIACRNLEKAEEAKDEIIKKSRNKNVVVRELDLASLESIRMFAQKVRETESRIDILINNAGILGAPYRLTKDGLEVQMQTNYFGPFLLTNLLLDLILKTDKSRIVNVCSSGHYLSRELNLSDLNFQENRLGGKTILPFKIYCTSQLCKILFNNELAARIKRQGKNTTVNCLHPGLVFTDIGKYSQLVTYLMWMFAVFLKTPKQGAQTSIYLAVDDGVANVTGKYFSDCHESKTSQLAQDQELGKTLWDVSEKLVDLRPDERVV